MAGIGPGDLDLAALDVLNAAVAALETIPSFDGLESLSGAPERRYLSPGRPPADCNQLTVHVQRIGEDATRPPGLGTGTRHKQEFRVNLVTFVITVYRCTPTIDKAGRAPSVAALEGADAQLNADAWALWNYIWNKLRAGELLGRCRLVYMDGIDALENSGGMGGFRLTIRGQIEGYEEAAG